MRPKLGVMEFNPVQYRTPLYQRIEQRGNVELDVLFLSDYGFTTYIDPGFGIPVAWNIDLLSDYTHSFLAKQDSAHRITYKVKQLHDWLVTHDVIVIYGHTNPWMLLAMTLCRSRKIPYLLRGESHAQSRSSGIRRHVRNAVARSVVSASAGGLAIGQLNEEFYYKYQAKKIFMAPYSVDDERFSQTPEVSRADLLAHWGLDVRKPVIMFCGKLSPMKRPDDLLAASRLIQQRVNLLFVGDGPLAGNIQNSMEADGGAVTGFINQLELPSYYHAADILVLPSASETWGLVVNEAMAAGVIPIVSDRVGAAPDLVDGVGEVYPCGDVTKLAEALRRALNQINDPEVKTMIRQRIARYSLDHTAAGFELAAGAVARRQAIHQTVA